MAIAIRCTGLTKRYSVERREPYGALRDVIAEKIRHPFTRKRPNMFLALDEFSADFHEGEVIGLIGSNGAGKSTLLKILSRVTRPSAGVAEIHGRVGSLLEVGTGFHPELTGRENIYFNGAILGMRKAEIDRHFGEIVAFSEISEFLDLPVKRYSSGMYVRLAFAVGAHLDTDVLLVDEVLAVGDAAFQKKCLGKMRDVTTSSGRTIVFVSHNLNAVQRLCSRSVMISHGRLVEDGPTEDVIAAYLRKGSETTPGEWVDLTTAPRRGSGEAKFTGLRVSGLPYADEPLEIDVEVVADAARTLPQLALSIHDNHGLTLINCDTLSTGEPIKLREGTNRLRLHIDSLHLNRGMYFVSLLLARGKTEHLDVVENAMTFDVAERSVASLGTRPEIDGVVTAEYSWLPE